MDPDRFLRPFNVLELLSTKFEGLRLTDIAEGLGMPLSSAHTLLKTMVQADVLETRADHRYAIGPGMIEVSLRIVENLDVRRVSRRYMLELADLTGDSVYLAVWSGDGVIYIDRIDGTRAVSIVVRLGSSAALPLHATAVGRLFAAYDPRAAEQLRTMELHPLTDKTITSRRALDAALAQIREDGFSVSREEATLGINGIAAPIRDSSGAVVAAVDLAYLAAGATAAREAKMIAAASEAVSRIQAELGVATAGRVERRAF